MLTILFVVSGYGAAGKSTVINSIAKDFDVTIISFGAIHKSAYKNAGYQRTVDWLAKEGYDVYQKSVLKLFKAEMDKVKGDAIIDGLFSQSCYNYLRILEMFYESRLINIFISTSKDERIRRMYDRQKLVIMEQAINHVEKSDFIKGTCGLCQIQDNADYIIDGNQNRETINSQIIQIVQLIKQLDKGREKGR